MASAAAETLASLTIASPSRSLLRPLPRRAAAGGGAVSIRLSAVLPRGLRRRLRARRGSRGIGRAVVEELAALGAVVHTCSRKEEELGERLKEWEAKGFRLTASVCDLSVRDQREISVVNTSGQFVGVAEMVGPVDFDKTVDYWQQDKWNGCFLVKWHIVKDVPNNILKHITLDNNDNKPVTNSCDTQEVKLVQGLEMLKIFKDHVSKTSILDDFVFYENRQKLMQEKRAKQQLLQGQACDAGNRNVSLEEDKNGIKGKQPIVQKQTLSEEGTPVAGEGLNASKPAAESGVANCN